MSTLVSLLAQLDTVDGPRRPRNRRTGNPVRFTAGAAGRSLRLPAGHESAWAPVHPAGDRGRRDGAAGGRRGGGARRHSRGGRPGCSCGIGAHRPPPFTRIPAMP